MEENENLNMNFLPSRLGTKEFWDSNYNVELKNFEEFGDIGEIWFGSNCTLKIISFINSLNLNKKTCKCLDIGCGNGHLSFILKKQGFNYIWATDYSEKAIELAKKISSSNFDINLLEEDEEEQIEENNQIKTNIYFMIDDILHTNIKEKFHLIIDKGTFDSISLNEKSQENQQIYIKNIKNLLEDYDSYFIITSCNFTKNELLQFFHHKDSNLAYYSEIKYPTLKFGGKEGSQVTTIVFTKRK
jgi:SAM-dependent methyltransferase